MPLLDHFHAPLNQERRWQGFHSFWASAVVGQLSNVLPPGYYAEPQVNVGVQLESDVATWEEREQSAARDENGGVATLRYAPPRPGLAFPVDFAGLEVYEVQVVHRESGPQLVGAIELVSPANKDRPSHRDAFVRKCATYLQEGVSLVIVDTVSARSGNFHALLVQTLAPQTVIELSDPQQLYAVAYRRVAALDEVRIEAWPEALAVGQPLPTLPLWLDLDLAVPVELEKSYQVTCETLRIRVA